MGRVARELGAGASMQFLTPHCWRYSLTSTSKIIMPRKGGWLNLIRIRLREFCFNLFIYFLKKLVHLFIVLDWALNFLHVVFIIYNSDIFFPEFFFKTLYFM